MSGWDDTESVLVGDRRMRVRRRRTRGRRIKPWPVLAAVVVLAAAGTGAYLYVNRPQGLDAIEGPAVSSSGAFQAKVNEPGIITVAMEIRNNADDPVTVVSARIVPPAGLSQVAIAVLDPGDQNQNLDLDAELPPTTPVTLGTEGVARNGAVVARYRVDCTRLPPTTGTTGEQIFVTVRLGGDEREEQVTPPVVDGVPWLSATARGACRSPEVDPAPSPLPPLDARPDPVH